MKRKKLQAQFPGNANSTFCQKMARNLLAFICINTLLNLLFPLFSLFSLLFSLAYRHPCTSATIFKIRHVNTVLQ